MGISVSEILSIINRCRLPQDFADHSIELIGNPIFIMDMNMRIIGITDCETGDDVYRQMLQDRFPPPVITDDLEWRSNLKAFLSGDKLNKSFAYGQNHLHKNLSMGGNIIGQVEAIEYFRPFTALDEEVLELISRACAISIFNQMSLRLPSGSRLDYWLEYILDGNEVTEEMIRLQAASRSWAPRKTIYCCVVDAFGEEPTQSRGLDGILEPGDKVVHYKNYLVIILSRVYGLKEPELARIGEELAENGKACGVSLPFTKLSELKRYFDQACAALEIGQRVDGTRAVYLYAEYIEYAMIRDCAKQTDVLRYVLPGLLELAEMDRTKHMGILTTLLIYFDSGKSVKAVAERLHMHRNTVNYRISRGLEILGIDIDDGKPMLQLAQSLRILEYADKEKYFI